MKKQIEYIKVDANGKKTLIRVKKKTGITNWNVLCRYALLLSINNLNILESETKSQPAEIIMDWKTFAGTYHDVLGAIISYNVAKMPSVNTKGSADSCADYVNANINQGIKYISEIANIKDIMHKIEQLSTNPEIFEYYISISPTSPGDSEKT